MDRRCRQRREPGSGADPPAAPVPLPAANLFNVVGMLFQFLPSAASRSEPFHKTFQDRLLDLAISEAAASKPVRPVGLHIGRPACAQSTPFPTENPRLHAPR
jgi:hypothetical protein